MKTESRSIHWLNVMTQALTVAGVLISLSLHAADIDLDKAIEQHRMGALIVKASPGASVRVEQIRHEFWFGAALTSSAFTGRLSPEDQRRYEEAFLTNFNAAVTENAFKWHSMETQRGQVDYSVVDAVLAWAQKHDLPAVSYTH